MRSTVAILGVLVLSLGVAHAQEKDKSTAAAIADGAKVQLDYTVKDDAGKVLDSSKGKAPLSFTQGQHQIIRGLEKALIGMRAGEAKKVTVKPEDGYGKVDPKAQIEVPKDQIPAEALKVGTMLHGRGPNGQPLPARVKAVNEKTVVLDTNHPLAGKTLYFDLKVVSVEQPAK